MTNVSPNASGPVSFWAALRTQGRVLHALLMRELHTRFGRENIGYLWMIGEPMLLASVIASLHASVSHIGHTSGDVKSVPFGIVGYTVFILFRGIINRSAGSIEANAPLLYHRSVTILDFCLTRALLEFFGVFSTYWILITICVGFGWASYPVRLDMFLAAWGLMFLYAFGNSLLIVALTYENHTLERLTHIYSYFMVGVSGAFYMMKWIPHPYREWLSWVPTTSIFELVRYGQFRDTDLELVYGKYLIGFCLIQLWIGLIVVRRTRHHVHLV